MEPRSTPHIREEMHDETSRRLSFDFWLPHDVETERASSTAMQQADHVTDSNVALFASSSDGLSSPKKCTNSCSGENFLL
jgi:hypothetical protein